MKNMSCRTLFIERFLTQAISFIQYLIPRAINLSMGVTKSIFEISRNWSISSQSLDKFIHLSNYNKKPYLSTHPSHSWVRIKDFHVGYSSVPLLLFWVGLVNSESQAGPRGTSQWWPHSVALLCACVVYFSCPWKTHLNMKHFSARIPSW